MLFILARNRINRDQAGSPASLGPAYWLVFAATLCLLIASFTICLGSRSARRAKRDEKAMASQPVYGQEPLMQEKRPFWQRRRY